MNPTTLLTYLLPFFLLPHPSTTAQTAVTCFDSLHPNILPTTYHACYQILKFVVSHGRVNLPYTFSRHPNRGYQLPEQWFYDTCVVQLDMNANDEEDTASFRDVAKAAGTVMLGCVAQPPHLGGTQFVGPKSVMNVSLFGIPRRTGRVVRVGSGRLGDLLSE
ncbi:MAG: hypothetical protein Q9171_003542 [Xanthocarpia ochracea]